MDRGGDSTIHQAPDLSQRISELRAEFSRELEAGRDPVIGPYLDRLELEGQEALLDSLRKTAIAFLKRSGTAEPASVLLSHNPQLQDRLESLQVAESEVNATALFTPGSPATPQSRMRRRSRGLHIRCPHCSNQVELVADTPLDSIDCNVCGSAFSLVDRSLDTRMATTLQKIDRFELVSRLGVGGFGTVWKARDTDLDRTVAVKIPRQGQLLPSEMEQFFREARSVAQLRHPNIAPVHEVGRDGDAVFIVSDFIRGVSLADMLTGGLPTPKEAATLCATIADALHHAHERGVIHRDLKPSNVMVDDEGVPHLMDFGLAKREADEVAMTMDGQVLGTPAYMSPEQARGKSAWADRRTDIYSLGVMLFEMLTGEFPFRGNAQMQVHQRTREDAPSVLTLNRHLPKDLATICAKCLEREPGNRYSTAKEVAAELQRFLEGVPILARPISPVERGVRWCVRHPLPAALAALVTFLAIAGPSVAVVIASKNRQLATKYQENANLITTRTQETNQATQRVAELQAQLDLWEGRANNWALWPPDAERPPRHVQFASLLKSSEETLRQGSPQETAQQAAQRLLALAMLHEGANQRDQAAGFYQAAAEALSEIVAQGSPSLDVPLALADCYDRLSLLSAATDRAKSIEWLERSLAVRRAAANAHPRDAELQALRLEAELRAGAQGGHATAGEHLQAAQTLSERLPALWPSDPAEVYRLACELAGRKAWLLSAPASAGAANDFRE